MRKSLKIWGPWVDNPSKPENFYGRKLEEEIEAEEIIENSINEEEITDENLEETPKESSDPYEKILKDLK